MLLSKPEVLKALTDTVIEVVLVVFIEVGVFMLDEFSPHLIQYFQLKITNHFPHLVFFLHI